MMKRADYEAQSHAHLLTAKDLTDILITKGHADPSELRLTIQARAARAKELVDNGLSQRQAAKALGVGQSTIHRDLIQNGSETDPKWIASRQAKAEAIRQRNHEIAARSVEVPRQRFPVIVADPPWPMTKIERDVRPNQVGFDYPTMDETQLLEFGKIINEMADDDARPQRLHAALHAAVAGWSAKSCQAC